MSKYFDTINIHTLIRKLLQTNVPGTIINFIANTSRDANPTQHTETTLPYNVNLKFAFPKMASSHPHYLTFTLQIYPPRAAIQVMTYTADISITSTHTSTSATKKYIQLYLHKVLSGKIITILHLIQTKQLALCSLWTLQNIRAFWTSK